ncbi:MAG: glutaredoxin [Saprospiraceae bacterium]|nr:glutaredoxin [Saprospiraceae bacterium]
MKTHAREILIYYNPNSSSDRKTVAHAKSTGLKIKSFHHAQAPSTRTSWKTILECLEMHPKDLLNKADPYYQSNLRGREFELEDWLNVLKRNPGLIKSPIAVSGRKAVLCTTPTDIYKL